MISVTTLAKALAPVVLIGVGMAGANWLYSTAPELERQQLEPTMPLVEVLPVVIQPQQLDVATHGELSPQNQVQLAAEVSAKVVWTSPQWHDGAYFRTGDELLKLDPVDYQLALAAAEAQVAQAEAALQVEQAESKAALLDWQQHGEGDAPALVAREPQLAMARANVSAAKASAAQAERALERCVVRAPIDGRVQLATAKLGQFVAAGSVLGSIYSTDKAELRLPIQMHELAWLEVTLGQSELDVAVELSGEVGGVEHQWQANAVSLEAQLDARNRMLTLVVEVDDPFALRKSSSHAPMVPGMFVAAKIGGRTFASLTTLPRSVLREDGTVLVIDGQDRVRIRPVKVLRASAKHAYIESGLETGERVCTTPITAVTEGMKVRVAAGE